MALMVDIHQGYLGRLAIYAAVGIMVNWCAWIATGQAPWVNRELLHASQVSFRMEKYER